MLRRMSSFRNTLKTEEDESVSLFRKPLFGSTLRVPDRLNRRSMSIDSFLHNLKHIKQSQSQYDPFNLSTKLNSTNSVSKASDSISGYVEELRNNKKIYHNDNDEDCKELSKRSSEEKEKVESLPQQQKKVMKNGLIAFVPQVCNDIACFVEKKVQMKKPLSSPTAFPNNKLSHLIFAIRKGSASQVRNILENPEIDVDAKDAKGVTAIHEAAICGQSDIIKLLIRYHAKLDEKDNEGYTCLDYAVFGGHFDCAKYLIDCGAPVTNIQDGVPLYFGKTNFA